MKRIYIFGAAVLCLLLCACSTARSGILFSPTVKDRVTAVSDIVGIERSTTEITDNTDITEPRYFEVVATSTTAPTVTKEPEGAQEPSIEYYTVKFVDYDGYSTISVQNVARGKAANEPPMPKKRGNLVFRGWNKEFSNINQSMIIKAIYTKEWVTVRFLDADGSLIKEEEILYGNKANAPYVPDKGEYFFDGWDKSFDKVTADIDVYATYYKIPTRSYTSVIDAYKLLTLTESKVGNTNGDFYKSFFSGVLTLGNNDYAGNILYGNFSDTLDISGFGFTSFEGKIALKNMPANDQSKYEIELFVYVDGVEKYHTRIDIRGLYKEFNVSLKGAKKLTVKVIPYVDGYVQEFEHGEFEFIGGIVDAVLYEN